MRTLLLSVVTIAALAIAGPAYGQGYGAAAANGQGYAVSNGPVGGNAVAGATADSRMTVSWEQTSFDASSPSYSTTSPTYYWVSYPKYTYLWYYTPRDGLMYWIDVKPGKIKYSDGKTQVTWTGPSRQDMLQYQQPYNWYDMYGYNANMYGYGLYGYPYGMYGYYPYGLYRGLIY